MPREPAAAARPSPSSFPGIILSGERGLETASITVGAFQSNCHLVRQPGSAQAVVIDPGAEPERVLEALNRWGADPVAILLTHAHLDHIGGVAGLLERYPVPLYLHDEDRPIYDSAAQQATMFGLELRQPPAPDHSLTHGQELNLAGLRLDVRFTPGHSPGHVVFVGPGLAFVGDCVFAGSIGRTDLPGGSAPTLLASIRDQILSLPPDTTLLTGHGPATTVAAEAASNPFLRDTSWAT
ncbi:MAG: MBL fold metallo-hydrolase [Gemmatimonadota bacterium]